MEDLREEILDILADCYGEDEERSAWGVAFEEVDVPVPALLLGIPITVENFRVNGAGTPQCLVRCNEPQQQTRWVAVEDLDTQDVPGDFRHVLTLYRAWLTGKYWKCGRPDFF